MKTYTARLLLNHVSVVNTAFEWPKVRDEVVLEAVAEAMAAASF
jgi:hypothetical protein